MAKPKNIPIDGQDYFGWYYEEQTKIKHRVLGAYARIWLSKLGCYSNTMFFDCHAGCGAYIDKNTGEVTYGSSFIIENIAEGINSKRSHKNYICTCEIESQYYDNFKKINQKIGKKTISLKNKDFETIKAVSRKHLYSSIKAESIELTGYSVITGILKRYEKLLDLSCEDFQKIENHENMPGKEYEKRLFNQIGRRYVKAYNYAVEALNRDNDFEINELWLRIHLIVDHISGMTDEFALETYQMLEGIQLLKT